MSEWVIDYTDFIWWIEQEMSMYDDLSRNDKYKKDRDIAKEKYKVLEEVRNYAIQYGHKN